jgi:hypothetical protein
MESPSLYSEKRSYLLQNMKKDKFIRNGTKTSSKVQNPLSTRTKSKTSIPPPLVVRNIRKSSLLSPQIIDNFINSNENVDNEKSNQNQSIFDDKYNNYKIDENNNNKINNIDYSPEKVLLDSFDSSEYEGSIIENNEMISLQKSQIFELQSEIDRLKNKLNNIISSTDSMFQEFLESQQEAELEFSKREKLLQDENIKLNNENINLNKIAELSKQEYEKEKKKLSKSLRFIERFCSRNNKEKIPSFTDMSLYIKTDLSSSKSSKM